MLQVTKEWKWRTTNKVVKITAKLFSLMHDTF